MDKGHGLFPLPLVGDLAELVFRYILVRVVLLPNMRWPEVAQILSGPKGSSDLWGELVVVVGQVPDQPQQVSEGTSGVGASLTGVPFYFFLEHWAQLQSPGVVNHFTDGKSIEMGKGRRFLPDLCFYSLQMLPLFQLEDVAHSLQETQPLGA